MVLTRLGVPTYSLERSDHMYSVHRKVRLLILRQYKDISFCELYSMLSSMRVRKGLVPDHSTLVKFSGTLDDGLLRKVMACIMMLLCGSYMTVAVDATGFSCSNASRYYARRHQRRVPAKGIRTIRPEVTSKCR